MIVGCVDGMPLFVECFHGYAAEENKLDKSWSVSHHSQLSFISSSNYCFSYLYCVLLYTSVSNVWGRTLVLGLSSDWWLGLGLAHLDLAFF